MAHTLVKILTFEGGDTVEDPVWCWVQNIDARRALCNGQAFGFAESGVEFKSKTVNRGGITCPYCLKYIKEFKEIKL